MSVSNGKEEDIMLKYIVKRILISIPLMIAVVLIVFLMLQVLPGNPVSVMMGEKANPAVIERVTEEMGLNRRFSSASVTT